MIGGTHPCGMGNLWIGGIYMVILCAHCFSPATRLVGIVLQPSDTRIIVLEAQGVQDLVGSYDVLNIVRTDDVSSANLSDIDIILCPSCGREIQQRGMRCDVRERSGRPFPPGLERGEDGKVMVYVIGCSRKPKMGAVRSAIEGFSDKPHGMCPVCDGPLGGE